MYELARRVRFLVSPPDRGPAIAAFAEMEVRCRGTPDPATGYVMNISAIDRAVRDRADQLLREAVHRWMAGDGRPVGDVLADVINALQPALGGTVASVRWQPSPYHWIALETEAMDRVLISRLFEFSAAHRLHSDQLTAAENRRVFGKCNNPSGHGHNYKLRAEASVPLAPGTPFGFPQLECLVDDLVIQRFDHKHLNLDTAEFADLNPSVEHIARVCHDLLADPIAGAGGRLERVTVWETDKTSCTYPVGNSRQPSAISHQPER